MILFMIINILIHFISLILMLLLNQAKKYQRMKLFKYNYLFKLKYHRSMMVLSYLKELFIINL